MKKRFQAAVYAGLGSLLVTVPAFAQGAAAGTGTAAQPAPADEADGPSSRGLNEIVVIAQKIEQNLQDVPVAVTAFSGEELEQQNATKFNDIARLTPSLYISKVSATETAPVITLRGQVQADVLATLDPSVGTYVDGYYWSRAYGLNSDLLDIQSVQTLKGPQGTLFGRNTTGGAILIQTNDPNFDGFSGSVSATYGRFNEMQGTAVLNLPIVDDKVAMRVAFSKSKRDGYVRNLFDGKKYGERDSWVGRAKLLVQPTDNFRLLFSAELYKSDARPVPYSLAQISTVGFTGATPSSGLGFLSYAIQSGFVGAGGFDIAGARAQLDQYIATSQNSDELSFNSPFRNYAKTQTYTGTASLDTAFGTVKFIGGYRNVKAAAPLDLDGTAVTLLNTGTIGTNSLQQDLTQYSGEFQITGQAFGDVVDFAAGIFYFHEKGNDGSQSTSLGFVNPNVPSIFDGTVSNDSQGIYGQASVHVTDKLTLTGGLRYSIEDKALTLRNRSFVAAANGFQCTLTGATLPDCRAFRRDSFNGISYNVGADYQFGDAMIYIKAGRGFRSGGENLRATGAAASSFVPFKPEVATSQEVGFKSEFLDRRVRLNVAAYHSVVNDIQRSVLVAGPGGTAATTVGNAGKLRVNGAEAELTARLFDGFTLGATGAITKPKYLEYFDGVKDRRTDRIGGVPHHTFSVSGTYEHDFGSTGLLLRADYVWTGKVALQSYNEVGDPNNAAIIAATTAPSAGIINARAALTFADGGFELALFGRNLTNNRDVQLGLVLPQPLGLTINQRREPRTFGITGTIRFGGK
ncbi:TonB-dependent receptor [Sphingopyxis lindanitolerans]|nr:TonB-dependent receptor [Sphingopyxis lindanitolerans]